MLFTSQQCMTTFYAIVKNALENALMLGKSGFYQEVRRYHEDTQIQTMTQEDLGHPPYYPQNPALIHYYMK